MKKTIAILPALLTAAPVLAHHEEAVTGSASLLHSPWGVAALGMLLLAAAMVARRVYAVSNTDKT